MFWDGEIPSEEIKLRLQSQSMLNDAQLNLTMVYALRLSHELVDLSRQGDFQDMFYGDESGWTRNNQINARDVYFWRLDRFCVLRQCELRLRLIFELHGIG
jgi:hypothetical protein